MALNPHQRNKVDISKLTEEEQKLFRLYGKLPSHKSVLNKSLKERKFFDSGDYALSKAGKSSPQSVGTAIPSPETIPHVKSPDSATSPTSGSTQPGIQISTTPVPPGSTAPSTPISGGSGGVTSNGPTSGLSHEVKEDEIMKDESSVGDENVIG